jgi:hypothetical protein
MPQSGWFHEWFTRIGDKTVTLCDRASGPLSCASAPQARRTRPVRVRSAHVASHESHRRALELQRAAVRGALPWALLVHPSATLECEHRRRPVMAAMACGLQPHPGGARHAARRYLNDRPGTAPTHRPTRSHTAQPDRNVLSVCGRRPLSAADGPHLGACHAALLGGGVRARWSTSRAPGAHHGAATLLESPALEVGGAAERRASRPRRRVRAI